jgi:hypothetical protein
VIEWEPNLIWEEPGSGSGSGEVPGVSVVGRLADLGKALADLDATDPETDSISFDKATDHLITTARHLVTAARPVLDHPGALAAAVQEAMADRRDVPNRCRDCEHAESGVCGDHAGDTARRPTSTPRSYPPSPTAANRGLRPANGRAAATPRPPRGMDGASPYPGPPPAATDSASPPLLSSLKPLLRC